MSFSWGQQPLSNEWDRQLRAASNFCFPLLTCNYRSAGPSDTWG